MYRARFIVAGSCVAIVAALFAGLALLPMYLALHSAEDLAAQSLPGKVSVTQDERQQIIRVQSLISTLGPFVFATTTPSEAIETALALRPKGVLVDHVQYSSGIPGEIMLVGSASTREGINTYRQALQSDPHFKTVSVPVGDLAGAKGGRFSVTLRGEF